MPHIYGVSSKTLNPFTRLLFWGVRLKLGRVVEPLRGYARSGWVLWGFVVLELLLMRTKLDRATRGLVELRVASLVGCSFCIDLGSALARAEGVSREQVLELHRFESSAVFTAAQQAALRFADLCCQTPMRDAKDAIAELRGYFSEKQIVELAAAIAHENMRARMNHALGYVSEGFSSDGVCALPARGVSPLAAGTV